MLGFSVRRFRSMKVKCLEEYIVKKTPPLEVSLPPPAREHLKEIAVAQGISQSALVRRLFYMYRRDPVAYETLFVQLKTSGAGTEQKH